MDTLKSYLQRNREFAYVFAAILFTFFVSIIFLMGNSIRLDEAQSVWQTNHSLLGTLHILAGDVHLPVYFIILRSWIMIFGSSVFTLRSLSLLFLLASFPVLYIVSKETYSKRIALFVILITSASPFLHWYGSEARMYTALFFITALNHLYFLRLLNKESSQLKSNWYLYALTVFIGAYTHLFFGFILITQVIFYLIYRSQFDARALKRFLLIAGGVLVQVIAWYILRVKSGSSNSNPLLHPPTTSDLFNVFSNVYIGLQGNTLNSFFLSLWPILVIIVFSLLARRQKINPETVYLFFCTFIPIIITFFLSIFVKPLFVARYLIIIVPSLYILTSYLISLYKQRTGNIIISVICIGMLMSLSVEIFSAGIPVHENYREAASYVQKSAKENDIFIVSAPFTTYPIEYYYRGTAPLATFPHWARYEDSKLIPPFSEEDLIKTSAVWAERYEYLYILLSYDQGYEEKTRIYLDTHYQRVSTKQFSPHLNLFVYKLRYL